MTSTAPAASSLRPADHPPTDHPPTPEVDAGLVLRAISRRDFCTLGSSSAANRPHVAGVLYEAVGTALYVSTLRGSRKTRNIAANPAVSVFIPIRRLPVGPPSSVLFAATAAILAPDDAGLGQLISEGRLRSITGHGELDLPDGCFLRISPSGPVHTYGLGMPLHRLIRDPLNAAGRTNLA